MSEAKRAVVVGGSKGIGLAMARAWRRAASVAVMSRDRRGRKRRRARWERRSGSPSISLTPPEIAGSSPGRRGSTISSSAPSRRPNSVKATDVAGAPATGDNQTRRLCRKSCHTLAPAFRGRRRGRALLAGRRANFPTGRDDGDVGQWRRQRDGAAPRGGACAGARQRHPSGVGGDSRAWVGGTEVADGCAPHPHRPAIVATTADCAGAAQFLLDNPGVNGPISRWTAASARRSGRRGISCAHGAACAAPAWSADRRPLESGGARLRRAARAGAGEAGEADQQHGPCRWLRHARVPYAIAAEVGLLIGPLEPPGPRDIPGAGAKCIKVRQGNLAEDGTVLVYAEIYNEIVGAREV